MDSIAESGWRPIKTMEALAKQQDPVIVEAAIEFMGKIREPRFTDLLLTMLKEQNPQNMNAVIRALGETGDGRATVALLAIAADPQQRAGREVDLADALANLGDQRAAPLIGEMIKKAQLIPVENRLRNAYRKLTGKNY
jgi:HEAT repeat protein